VIARTRGPTRVGRPYAVPCPIATSNRYVQSLRPIATSNRTPRYRSGASASSRWLYFWRALRYWRKVCRPISAQAANVCSRPAHRGGVPGVLGRHADGPRGRTTTTTGSSTAMLP
jgi:hypothetical protein